MSYKICVLPGDGIGKEVTDVAVRVLQSLDISFDFIFGDIGFGSYKKNGSSLPDATLKKIETSDAVLFGAVTTPPNIPGYKSPILQLRQHFRLFANVRPVKSIPNPISKENIDMVIFRENTEDLYSGVERVEDGGNKAVSEMIITRKASERILRYGFGYAKKNNLATVHVVHKANVLRETCGLFLRVAQEVAKDFPGIEMQDMLVDSCAMQLIKNPGQFKAIITTNMFGDILSDEASMLAGGLGIAYSGNIGEKTGVFEPVHGSAPKYENTNSANPIAAILSAKLMLEFLGENKSAGILYDSVMESIRQNKVTGDLGGTCGTKEAADEIIKIIKSKSKGEAG